MQRCSLTWWFCCRHHITGSYHCPRAPAVLPAGWSCGSAWAWAGPAAGAGSRRCSSCLGESGRQSWGPWPKVDGWMDQNCLPLQSWSLGHMKGQFWILHACILPNVCWDSLLCQTVSTDKLVLRVKNRNASAQPLLDAAGRLSTHQQEQELTIWFICSLVLGRRGSWLKAVRRKWLIRKDTLNTHTPW